MAEDKKMYFNIVEMTEAWKAQSRATDPEMWDSQVLLMWQVRAQLAIAQQLSVISGHLAEIVDKSKQK